MRCVLFFALMVFPTPAFAHLVDIRFGDFYGGAIHLLTGLQYALLLVALSILAALQDKTTGRWMLAVAPICMLLGAIIAMLAPHDGISVTVTVALGLLGLVVALGARLVPLTLMALGGLSAGLLGYENGLAITAQSDAILFLSGLTLATLVTVCLLTASLTRLVSLGRWAQIGLRAVGSWIAAVAFILVALAVNGPVQAG